jgi:hypothetical protein
MSRVVCKQQRQHLSQRARAAGGDKAVEIVGVQRRAGQSGRAHKRERGDPLRLGERRRQRHSPAQRMADQMRLAHA